MVAIGLEWCFFANIPPVLLMSGTSRIIIEIFKVEKIGKKGKGYPNGKFVLKGWLDLVAIGSEGFWETISS